MLAPGQGCLVCHPVVEGGRVRGHMHVDTGLTGLCSMGDQRDEAGRGGGERTGEDCTHFS